MKKIFLFMIITTILSCSKDDCMDLDCITNSVCHSDCINIEDSIYNNWGTQHNEVNYSQFAFSTNPNNQNEIIYVRLKRDSLEFSYQLVKYNRQNKISTILYESNLGPYGSFPPRWNSDNSIYFDMNNKIYKIDSQGENLSLIDSGSDFKLLFDSSNDGKKIIYKDQENLLTTILNTENNQTERIENSDGYQYVTFAPNENQIAFLNNYSDGRSYIAIQTVGSSEVNELLEVENSSILGLTWSNNGEYIYWSDMSGLYRFNVNDNNVERIIQHCGYTSNRKYVYPYIDNNGTLYLTKETAWKSDGNEISLKGKIIEYDLNTCTEIDIFD